MVEKQKYDAYAAATQTVAPVRQIVLLYEGTIRCVQHAKEAINENRIEDRYNLLIKAAELIGGLQGCLDFDNGGEIAKILHSYYSSIDAQLFSIHRTNSIEDCDAIIDDLKQMRDAWNDIDKDEKPSNSQYSEASKSSASSSSGNVDVSLNKIEGLTLSA